MFDLTSVETTSGDFEPIPTGIYPAYVEKLEWKTSKAGADYLNIMFKIFGEKYANRVVFSMLHLLNKNETARNIALADLKRMLIASGWKEDELNFDSKESVAEAVKQVRCKIKVTIKRDEQYGDKNEVKGFEPLKEDEDSGFDTSSSSIPF